MKTSNRFISIRKILPHIIALLFLIGIPLLLDDTNNRRSAEFELRLYFQLTFLVAAFYINYYILVPKFFLTKKRLQYFLLAVILIAVLMMFQQIIVEFLTPENLKSLSRKNSPGRNFGNRSLFWRSFPFINNAIFMILIVGFSTGVRLINELKKRELTEKEKEKAHLDSELAFLKNQISPHFFFNTLNNIYALIEMNRGQAQEAVEKLSDMMRYLIYESEGKDIPLYKEIDFMQNYIELMKLRISSKVKLDIVFPKKIPNINIPPLLMIPFIENAFKHGITLQNDSYIIISMVITDMELLFVCKNGVPQNSTQAKDSVGGIGLSNVKKRLEILYNKRANLTIKNSENEFSVILKLPIKNI